MPKTYLSTNAREEAREAQRNEVFVWALKTVQARLGQTYTQTAEAVGTTRNRLYVLRNPLAVNNARFGMVRKIAHEIGMTREEWLKFGGFDK